MVGNGIVGRWDYLGLLNNFDVAEALFLHWVAPNGHEPFHRDGDLNSDWKDWARSIETIRKEARTEYFRATQRVVRSEEHSYVFHHRRAFELDPDYFIRLSLNGIRYVIHGRVVRESECRVVLEAPRHAILDMGDFDGDDFVDFVGTWMAFGAYLDEEMPSLRRYQEFHIAIQWTEDNFVFEIKDGVLVPQDDRQWPFGITTSP
jgi:hypothetical protein